MTALDRPAEGDAIAASAVESGRAGVPYMRWLLAVWALVLAALFAFAFSGALGALVVCGADVATLCVAWPGVASAGLWTVFIGTIAGLIAFQARTWRGAPVTHRELIALGAVLALALLERVWRIGLAQVAYDEAAAASLVAAWHYEGLFPLTGIVSSVGIPNPPGWPYLLALALLPFDSPYALVALGVLNGIGAIALTWWVGRRWIRQWAGLAAAVFYAGGFWSIWLGRGGWQPEFLQAPVILCLDALLVLAVRRQPWALALAAGWLGLMVQLHYVALLFAVLLPLAVWPARTRLRLHHVALALLVALTLLSPFLLYELNPTVRFRDFTSLAADAGETARLDLNSWNLFWTLASNGGAAGLGGPDVAGLAQALGRWTQIGLIGIPLVAAGLGVAILRWPRGWRGWLIALWLAAPIVLLVRHTQGVLFHYLYLALPGMALCVGGLFEWTRGWARLVVAAALAAYVGVSAATLSVVLDHVERTGTYPGLGKPLALNMAAAEAASAAVADGGKVLIGGYPFEVEVLRFGVGYARGPVVFDDCGTPPVARPGDVYLLNSERTPAAGALQSAGAPMLGRVARPSGDAFLVLGPPTAPPPPITGEVPECRDRFR